MNSKRSTDSIVTQRHSKVTPSRHGTINEIQCRSLSSIFVNFFIKN